ncbi:MAG: LuxR C-terminal-related transcriptional regulator [Acidimicrobiales bacterium]
MALSPPTVPGGLPGSELRDALAAFLTGSAVPADVRGEIGASWRRSAASGLDPDRLDVPFDPDLDLDGQLVRAAAPVLDQLVADVGDAAVAFILTKQAGEVLDRRVSESYLMTRLDAILLAPGFRYAENAVGTNGIGTALAQRRPAVVEGDEHYADALTDFACAAAPICDPASGEVIGAIDLTSLAADANALMLPFVSRAAREIEQRLVDTAGLAERIMLQRYLQERKRAKGPVVVMTDQRMVANAAADRLIGELDELILRESAMRALATGATAPSTVKLSDGTAVALRVEPILDGGSPVGSLLRLGVLADPTGDGPCHGARRVTFGWEALTATERSVTELVAQGLTNQEAAERLLLSRHTVGFHLRSIFRKLDVSSRVELTRLVVQHKAEPH